MNYPLKRNLALRLIICTCLSVMTTSQAYAQDAATQRIKQLESTLQQIQDELNRIKAESARTQEMHNELNRVKAESAETTQRIEQIEEARVAREKARDEGMSNKKIMLFFRGGYGRSDEHRNGVSIESRVAPIGAQEQADRHAWYTGAGFDFQLTKDTWGYIPKTEIHAELMFEYLQYGHGIQGNVLANAPTQLAGGALNPRGVTVNQFTLTASPKIKFNHFAEYKIRPWIIPAGLAIHVISPPSESITYIDPGIMFAGGVEYNIWRDFFIGADARYQLTAGSLDGAKFGGMTVGGYLGIGF
ncbi:MAG: porin family protein [Nitrosomonas sp.]|uniref:coiled-coil domain-containing protein n=1 Tax=Nitrosomonas sp. TaxID=42353 RepID=UPI0025CED280|nr:porin family protein [Nitrosomonas sp.]MBY0473433.1 porin family protein [Nitrosomonas sp.]